MMLPLLGGVLLGLAVRSLGLSEVGLQAAAAGPRLAELQAQEASPGNRHKQSVDVDMGDAKDIVEGERLGSMPARVQVMFMLAADMAEENWLRSGGEGAQALKRGFGQSRAVSNKVAERCAGKEQDCSWKQRDAMMCELLQLVGISDSGLGDPQTLERALVAHAGSTGLVGVDWTARAAMIAKWKEQVKVPTLRGSSDFARMKRRVLKNRYFQILVNRTCVDLEKYRPDCQPIARDALFCDAVAQASTIAVGTDAGHRVVLARMELQFAPEQVLLGSSPLKRQLASSLEHRSVREDEFSTEQAQVEREERARERQLDVDEANWDAAPRLAQMGVSP